MKRSLGALVVTLLVVCSAHAVLAAGEREAIVRALQGYADRLAAAGYALSWGSVDTGGGLFTTDLTVTDLALSELGGGLQLDIATVELLDVGVGDAGRIEKIETLRLAGIAAEGIDLSSEPRQPAPILPSVTRETVASGRIAELSLKGLDADLLFDLLDSATGAGGGAVSLIAGSGRKDIQAHGLAFTVRTTTTIPTKGGAPKTTTSRSHVEIASAGAKSIEDNAFLEFLVQDLSARYQEGSAANRGSSSIGSIRAVVADISAPGLQGKDDLLDLFFHPLLREGEVRDHVQTNDWLVVTSERDWWRHETSDSGGGRFAYGSDRTVWTAPPTSMLRGIFEQHLGPEARLVSTIAGSTTYDPVRRAVSVDGTFDYDRLAGFGWNLTLSSIPKLSLVDLQTGAKNWEEQPPVVLDRWEASVTDEGLREIAFKVLATMSKEKHTPRQAQVGVLNWIDQISRGVDPGQSPLTALAVGAVKSFIRGGGTLRAATDLPQTLSKQALREEKTRSELAAIDRYQILIEHSPAR